MKKTAIVSSLAFAAAAIAADAPSAKQLQTFPKNLARQHYSTNVFLFDAATQRYVATEAAAAWLDDDVTTGWPALAGKQHYMLQFAEPQMLTNFALSTRKTDGTLTIYTGDQAANPGDKSWSVAAKDIAVDSVNHKKLAASLNKTAKYLLIETNIPQPGPIYSLYLYGDKSVATESIVQRAQAVDIRTVAGEFANNQTAFNISSLYAKASVTHAKADGSALAWQRAIDDNPESLVSIKPSGGESGMIIHFDSPHVVSRLSVLSDATAKGKLDIFLLAQAPAGSKPVSLEGILPAATLNFDGTINRSSADIAETTSAALALRWTPDSGDAAFPLRELNTFADLSLAEYEVSGEPLAIGEGPTTTAPDAEKDEAAKSADGKTLTPVGEGTETADFKGGSGKEMKGELPPEIGAGPGGFRPGVVGFPPRTPPVVVVPPRRDRPVSP